jgi:hypothetical protein
VAVTLGANGVTVRDVAPAVVAIVAVLVLPRYREWCSGFANLLRGEVGATVTLESGADLRREEAAIGGPQSSHG